MLDNTSYIIFKKFKSSTEIMLSQKLNLIQSDNLQELVCTITSCEFKFLIQRIFSIFLEKSQIVSAVYKWQRIQSSGSGKKSNTVKRTTAENVNRVYRRPGRHQLQTGSEECGSVSRLVEWRHSGAAWARCPPSAHSVHPLTAAPAPDLHSI